MDDLLFTLRVRPYLEGKTIIIRAYYAGVRHGRDTIEVEVRQGGEIIFPRGSLRCGLGASHSVDGIPARELVMTLVAMAPGDTDAEYFASYTPAQIEWARSNGEVIGGEREYRYCHPDTGACARDEAEVRRFRRLRS